MNVTLEVVPCAYVHGSNTKTFGLTENHELVYGDGSRLPDGASPVKFYLVDAEGVVIPKAGDLYVYYSRSPQGNPVREIRQCVQEVEYHSQKGALLDGRFPLADCRKVVMENAEILSCRFTGVIETKYPVRSMVEAQQQCLQAVMDGKRSITIIEREGSTLLNLQRRSYLIK